MTRKLLVIDDHKEMRDIVAQYFSRRGWEVCGAATGQEGLAKIDEVKPDCVITDLGLPDVDGFEICRRLKDKPAAACPAIVMMTGTYRRDEERLRGLRLGADVYILKPFRLKDLEQHVEDAVKARRPPLP